MSLAVIQSRAKSGIDAPLVSVEVHLSNGLPAFHLVGLPETSVKESKDRVRSAIINSHFEFPARRITVNLAPADIPKEGSRFDLAIAIGILAASEQIPVNCLNEYEFIGELALTGDIRSVEATLPSAQQAAKKQHKLIIATANAPEARLVESLEILPANHLLEISAHLHDRQLLEPWIGQIVKSDRVNPELRDIIGQHHAKRAMELAATGGHNLLFYGPPGTGKTMLASRLPGILPPLSNQEALEVAAIHSVAGKGLRKNIWERPFRAPHHTASAAALVGGGASPRPGEISLAHKGVLFLDELPEFSRNVLEVLREPLESGKIMISRVSAQTEYPASFQLSAAMNPCPCGYLGDKRCVCSFDQITRYRNKISGPLMDRIDLHVQVSAIDNHDLLNQSTAPKGESNDQIQKRVCAARDRQLKRQGKINNQLTSKEIRQLCPLDEPLRDLMNKAIERFGLSARGFYRVLKVARSLADLEASEYPKSRHYQEALSYRPTIPENQHS
ncbi:MAG: YifB family Mg chelatase-like AAA ATPase [Porticoccaceae bacterium]|nr:YifB family Mg chelatase-like AAA ATPase [Porticoccaceae bacterium]